MGLIYLCLYLHIKYPSFLSDFNENKKIRHVGAELFRADRPTDIRTDGQVAEQGDTFKLTPTFYNFANVPRTAD